MTSLDKYQIFAGTNNDEIKEIKKRRNLKRTILNILIKVSQVTIFQIRL